MALRNPIVDANGRLTEMPNGDYIKPSSLGAGTPSSNTVLDGTGNWVTTASLNYWSLSGSDVYRTTGNVYIGHSSSLGAYKLQVTGEIYNSNLTGTEALLKSVNGVIVRASSTDIATILGSAASSNYIQNQYASEQTANAWISGAFKLNQLTANYAFLNESYPIVFTNNGQQNIWSQGTLGKVQFMDSGGGTVNWSIAQDGTNYVKGNLGVGISSPTSLYGRTVHIQETSGATLYLSSGSIGGFLATASSLSAFVITSASAHPITFGVNYSEKARITLNGRFLLGYTSEANSHKMQIDSGSTTGEGIYVNGSIRATGNIIADGYFSGTSSDRIYKSNFKEVNVYNVIDNIGVSSYNHKLYDNKRLIGSVAQEVEKYFPELITKDSNGRLRVDNYGYAALALQLGKETKTEVEKLKERVLELENILGI